MDTESLILTVAFIVLYVIGIAIWGENMHPYFIASEIAVCIGYLNTINNDNRKNKK
jgi:hypothetical protein